jgi:hypothetical protein
MHKRHALYTVYTDTSWPLLHVCNLLKCCMQMFTAHACTHALHRNKYFECCWRSVFSAPAAACLLLPAACLQGPLFTSCYLLLQGHCSPAAACCCRAIVHQFLPAACQGHCSPVAACCCYRAIVHQFLPAAAAAGPLFTSCQGSHLLRGASCRGLLKRQPALGPLRSYASAASGDPETDR